MTGVIPERIHASRVDPGHSCGATAGLNVLASRARLTNIQRGTPGAFTTPYTINFDVPNGTSNTIYRSSTAGTSTNSANVVTNFYAPVTNGNFEKGSDAYTFTDNVSNDVDRAFWFLGEKVAY
jgi:hypothetical protein